MGQVCTEGLVEAIPRVLARLIKGQLALMQDDGAGAKLEDAPDMV